MLRLNVSRLGFLVLGINRLAVHLAAHLSERSDFEPIFRDASEKAIRDLKNMHTAGMSIETEAKSLGQAIKDLESFIEIMPQRVTEVDK
jgi:hypothetical protein